jgi:hypothetical protein
MRPKRAFKAGEVVLLDDILDIRRLELGVAVARSEAIVFINSHGWRKSLFFDFTPLLQPPQERNYELEVLLGLQHEYLLFQDQLKISEVQWQVILDQHWFPFRYLPIDVTRQMLNIAGAGWSIDEILENPKTLESVKQAIENHAAGLKASAFAEHRGLLVHAFERYLADDFKSAVSILYPRIEGVLRSIHADVATEWPTSSRVVSSATLRYERVLGEGTVLMPAKFREFLSRVYYREWHHGDSPEHVSRHTVSHGVAPVDKFDRKSAIVGILTVLQLGLYGDIEVRHADAPQDVGKTDEPAAG